MLKINWPDRDVNPRRGIWESSAEHASLHQLSLDQCVVKTTLISSLGLPFVYPNFCTEIDIWFKFLLWVRNISILWKKWRNRKKNKFVNIFVMVPRWICALVSKGRFQSTQMVFVLQISTDFTRIFSTAIK